jgi:hypothetical protein
LWGSPYIRDDAWETFCKMAPDRMMSIILSRPEASLGGLRGLVLEPLVHNLLTQSGVVGRMRNLETNKEMGTVRLGPWKTQHLYYNHSQLGIDKDVYNVPHKSNEGAIDAIVPYDGYIFQVTVSDSHTISRPSLDALFKTQVFQPFQCGTPGKIANAGETKPGKKPKRKTAKEPGPMPVKFVWMVEAPVYDTFKKQKFVGVKKEPYQDPTTRNFYDGLVQMAFEVDMRTVYHFHHSKSSKKQNVVKMTDVKTLSKLENVFSKFRRSDDVAADSNTQSSALALKA